MGKWPLKSNTEGSRTPTDHHSYIRGRRGCCEEQVPAAEKSLRVPGVAVCLSPQEFTGVFQCLWKSTVQWERALSFPFPSSGS